MSRFRLFPVLAVLLLELGIGAPHAAAGQQIPSAVVAALKRVDLPLTSVGLVVQDAGRAKPLIAYQADRAMNPASTMKLLTTYAGLELLGPAYTWKTEVYTDVPIKDGTLDGNLIIKGYGDPKLTIENFWRLLRDLRQQGLQRIKGDLVLDTSYFAPLSGSPGAFDNKPFRPYNALPSALLVNFNAVRLKFFPQPATGTLRVVADPQSPDLQLTTANLRLQEGPCGDWEEGITKDIRSNGTGAAVSLSGTYPMACGNRDMALNILPDSQYVYILFRSLWTELGGTLDGGYRLGPVPATASLMAAFPSPPLAEVIRDINKYSNNVMARELFLTLGAVREAPPGTIDKSIAAVDDWLAAKNLRFPELVLENGAGLSRIERISPAHMADLLLDAYRSPAFAELESSLPIVSVDGTMAKRLKDMPVAGHAHIKTGTLDGVKTMAGYVFDEKGRRMVVVFMINAPNAAAGKAAQDALLDWVYHRP